MTDGSQTPGTIESVPNSKNDQKATGIRSIWQFKLAAVAIVIVSGLIYLPSVRGSMIWDDTFLLKTDGLGGATHVAQCFTRVFLYHYYRPLTSASFVFERGMWATSTFGYHCTNILLHVATTAVMIPLLLAAFLSRRIALAGTALFAVQPDQSSTIAWIGGRTDSLCTLFVALFLLALVSGARSVGKRRTGLLFTAFLCFAAAAAAKEQALALAPLFPLALYIFRETGSGSEEPISTNSQKVGIVKANLREMAFWTTLCVILIPCQLLAWKHFGDPVRPHWNLAFQGTAIGKTIDYYLMILVTPTPALLHTWTLASISKSGWIGVVIGYVLAAAAIALFVRSMRSNPVLAWFLAGFALLLLPVTNIFPLVTQIVAPYRSGTAGFAAAAILGWAVVALVDRVSAPSPANRRSYLIIAPFGVYLFWLGYLCIWDNRNWQDQLTASLAVEMYDTTSSFGTLEAAATYLDLGQIEPAVSRLDKLVDLFHHKRYNIEKSDSVLWYMNGGFPKDWTGELYGRAGQMELTRNNRTYAVELLNKGRALNPSNEIVCSALANCAFGVNDLEGGAEVLQSLLHYRPKLTDDRIVLGRVLLKLKRWKEADKEFTICLSYKPNLDTLYIYTAQARLMAGNRSGAADVLTDGLKRNVLDRDKLNEWLASTGEREMRF